MIIEEIRNHEAALRLDLERLKEVQTRIRQRKHIIAALKHGLTTAERAILYPPAPIPPPDN